MSEEVKQETTTTELVPIKVSVSDEFIKQMGEEYAKQMQVLAPQEYYNISVDGKTQKFKRRKIYSKERRELEALRQKLAKEAESNSPKYPDTEDKLYKTMAGMYLIDTETNKGMTDDQFDLTVFEDVKNILNACAFRTERPIPSPFENKAIQ